VHDAQAPPHRPPRAGHARARRHGTEEDHLAARRRRGRPRGGRAAPARPLEDGNDMTRSDALAERCKALKLILTDVDGVLTDGPALPLPDGREAKAFPIRDGLGIVLAHRVGLRTGMLSGRRSEAVARRGAELGMSILLQGIEDKAVAFRDLLAAEKLE